MPRFSAFSQHGAQRFSSRKPHGQLIYEDRMRNAGAGKAFSDEWGGLFSAEMYADAMLEGTTRHFLERVGSQFRPTKAVELLPFLEKKFGVVTTRTATIHDRQTAVAAAAKVSRGARRENILAVLTALLGADFLWYYTVPAASATVSSATPGAVGNYPKPGSYGQVIRLTAAALAVGYAVSVPYEYVAGYTEQLKAGQMLWVDGGDLGRAETVTLTGASDTEITAIFAKTHQPGALATSSRAPFLVSNKRHNVIALSSTAVRDPEKRRQVHKQLRKLLRSVSTWTLTEETSSGVAGPFKVGVGKLGITPIGTVAS